MDYKKKYKDALERAKKYKLKEDLIITQDIFPELKESEDEKIRKQIKAFIKSRGSQITQSKTDDWLAWLEKQGEQKPIVIPKFKVGDKVRLKGSCGWYNVTEIRGIEYYLTSDDVVPCLLPICKQDDWEVEQKPLLPKDDNYALKASEEYRKGRESCGIKDPIILNEIEDAYYAGATLKPHPKQEWSEDDEEELEIAIDTLKGSGQYDSAKWVQSLKQRIGG